MKTRIWVGLRFNSAGREVFTYAETPTPETHPRYVAVIGPFRTMRAARLMCEPSAGSNPHLRTVADAERIALIRDRLGVAT